MNTSETLNRAADLIEKHGWGQGSASMMGGGGLCVMGAIFAAQAGRVAAEAEVDEEAAYHAVAQCPAGRAMTRYLAPRLESQLWVWNDDLPGLTGHTEVIGALRACAVIQAARERETAAVAS